MRQSHLPDFKKENSTAGGRGGGGVFVGGPCFPSPEHLVGCVAEGVAAAGARHQLGCESSADPQDRGSFYEDQRAKNQTQKGKKEPLFEEVVLGSEKPNWVGGRQSPLGGYQGFE